MPRKRKVELAEEVKDGPDEDGIDDPAKDPFEDEDELANPLLKKLTKAKRPRKRLQGPED